MNRIQYPSEAEYVFLDLDGTLTDPSVGIINATIQALEYFGIHEDDREKLADFIGPPLYVSFAKHYGFDLEKSKKAIEVFQDYYAPKGLYENTPYPGMRELLARWNEEGRKLVLATSKPEIFAMQILERFGMAGSFTFIAGGDPCETRVHKSDVIEPDDGVAAIGSGGAYALAAARALAKHTSMGPAEIVREAMALAADICVFTNSHLTLETIEK